MAAASRKCEKCATLPNFYIFQPIALTNFGTQLTAVALFFSHGHKISTKYNYLCESTLLFQCIAITLQRLISIVLHSSARVVLGMTLNCVHIFIVTGSFLY